MRKIILFFIFSSIFYFSNAQRTLFRTDSAGFFVDFYDLAKKSGKDGQKVYVKLKNQWDSLYFKEKEKVEIIRNMNSLLKKNATLIPFIDNYLEVIYSFSKVGHDYNSYLEWDRAFKYYIKRNSLPRINALLLTTRKTLQNNILYTKGNLSWYHTGKFNYEFKKRQLLAHFAKGNLVGKLLKDSTYISNTQGILFAFSNKWEGTGGIVNWIKAGIDSLQRIVELTSYTIKLTGTSYSAEKVNFTDNLYGMASIDGSFKDKIIQIRTPKNDKAKLKAQLQKNTFPKFKSYSENLQLNNLFGWINYKGGIEVRGYKTYGFANKEYRANLWLVENKKIIGHFRSRSFVFTDTTISSLNSSISIKVDTSQLYHPGLSFQIIGKKATFFRANKGLAQSPFYDNFHQITIFADIAEWNIPKKEIKFKNNITSSLGYIYIRSADFFDPEDPIIKGRYPKNPAIIIKDFGANEFEDIELARYMNKPLNQVSHMLLALSYKGLIEYDNETHKARLLPQFEDYLQKLTGNEDYDNFHMMSEPQRASMPGAILNLENQELTVKSLWPVPISEKRNLIVTPKNDSLVFKTGRNFNFDGSLTIGLLVFKGRNFRFNYDAFKINLDSVEYMTLSVHEQSADSLYNGRIRRVLNVIEKLRGDILIDDPTNKSGLDSFPEYPILTTYDTSYVYYDKVVKPLGVYPRDKFYFQVYPFKIDSLAKFNTQKFHLLGEFHSDSIFPVFKDVNLVIQPDLSLGFNKPSSKTGDSLYGGKGLFFNDIVLDSRGLNARGEIRYLNASIFSPHFNFYPDSMTTVAEKIKINSKNEGFQFPDIVSDSNAVFVQWYPMQDSLWLNNDSLFAQKSSLKLYKSEARMHGKLLMQPNGIKGSGEIKIKNGTFVSNKYKFKSRIFDADSANFQLITPNTKQQITNYSDSTDFKTVNVQAHVDLDQRIAKLKSNGDDSYINFPQNQYLCYMSEMIWYIDKDGIDLNSTTDSSSAVEAKGALFVSTRSEQDSLSFYAQSSNFDATNKIITAKGVSQILVANAEIKPDNEIVTIEKRAKMRTLDNARIKAGKFQFENSTVSIQGKYALIGSGQYKYKDERDSIESISINKLSIDDSTKVLIAQGRIAQIQNFKLSPVYNYYGDVYINTTDSLAEFIGKVQLIHNCDKLEINPISRPYYSFDAKINPDSIIIPITDVNHENAPYIATVITTDSTHIYSTFLSPVNFWSDYPIIKTKGEMYYDRLTHTFKVANEQKLKSPEERGTILMLNKDFCNIYGQGAIDFGVKYGQMKILATGELFHKIEADQITLNSTFSLDFFFNQQCKDIIYNTLKQAPSLQSIDLSSENIQRDYVELAGKKAITKILNELSTDGEIKSVPEVFNKMFVFADVKLVWNKETKSYINQGLIPIAFIDGKPINKKVYGFIELTKKKSGNLMNLYLEINKKTWFYFTFSRNVLKTYSSIDEYNNIISSLKEKERRMEVPRNQPPFVYYLSSERVKNKFLFRVEPQEEEDEW